MTAHPISASVSLMEVVNWDGESQDTARVLASAFDADDYLDCINDLQRRNIEPLLYIDGLDKVGSLSATPRLVDNNLLTDHRHASTRFGATKTMHTSAKEDVWLTWDSSHFLCSYLRAQQAWPTAVRIWRIRRCLETRRRSRPQSGVRRQIASRV